MKKMLIVLGLSMIATTASAYEKVYLDRLLKSLQCNYCNLSEADLNGHELNGADMSEANLKGIN